MPPRSGTMRAVGRVLATAALVIVAPSCALLGSGADELRETRVIHGTEVTIRVREADEASGHAAIALAFAAAEDIGGKLLAGIRGSEIDILVHVPSHVWVEISRTTYDALTDALEVAEATEGAYDPTWTPLLKLWGLTEGRTPATPRDFEIDTILRRVDWTNLEVTDEEGLQGRRLSRRTEIELGALARGAMLDGAVAQLRLSGVAAGRASTQLEHVVFGGTRLAPWEIALPNGTAELRDGAIAVAISGQLITTQTGEVIHDRFDPRDGRPARQAGWVALVSERASVSAAYADAVFVMGAEGPAFVEERSELHAAIEDTLGKRWASSDLAVRD